MENKDLDNEFFIQSDLLREVEPWMVKYFDYDSSMLIDIIDQTVEEQCKFTDYSSIQEDGTIIIEHLKHFYNTDNLRFTDEQYTHRKGINKSSTYKDLCDEFPQYFNMIDFEKTKDAEELKELYLIYIALSYMSYIYFRQKNDDFSFKTNRFARDADLKYKSVLNQEIYPEILSLYKTILESKKQYKKQGDKITIIYKNDKLEINSYGWFMDDMEKYFKDRFPDLTLEKIDELLPKPQKGGRKPKDPYVMIMIWGTYQLMKNHHPAFKNSKTLISMDICRFIRDYLKFCNIIKPEFVDTDIKDNLKDMIKRGYKPQWDLPWRNALSSIQEKHPESSFDKQPQLFKRYKLSNRL